LTEIYLGDVCSCQQILRRNGRGQDVHRFPLLVQDSAHNVHTWSFARQVTGSWGEKFLRRFQVFCGWYAVLLLGAVGTVWWHLMDYASPRGPGGQVPLWLVSLKRLLDDSPWLQFASECQRF
jgi:hypothetical protein